MSAPNAELAYRVLDLTKAHPAHLNMDQWASGLVGLDDLTAPSCGTTACYAGWTAAQAGYKVNREGFVFDADLAIAASDVEELAARLLGITDEQANELFYVSNEYLDLTVAEIFGPRPVERASGEWQVCPDCGDPVTGACRPGACVNTDEPVIFVDHGPVKPPYGTPERAAYDQAHGGKS